MNNEFKIFIDRLNDGNEVEIEEKVSSKFLDVQEPELHFAPDVTFKGKAYLADDHLVIHLQVRATAIMPCKICNEPVQVPLNLHDLTFTEPVKEIFSSIFDFSPLLREAILLELPPFIECHEGTCPEREDVKKFFTPKGQNEKQNDHFFPFSSLGS